MTFRIAQPEDAENALAFYRTTAKSPITSWNDEYPAKEHIDADIRNQGLVLMEDAGGKIIAAGAFCPVDEFADVQWNDGLKNPCELSRLGVLPELQGKGVAKLMMQEVFKAAKAKGYDGGHMMVAVSNDRARAIYRKAGFIPLMVTDMYDETFELNYIVF